MEVVMRQRTCYYWILLNSVSAVIFSMMLSDTVKTNLMLSVGKKNQEHFVAKTYTDLQVKE